jgi:hypothetical protein
VTLLRKIERSCSQKSTGPIDCRMPQRHQYISRSRQDRRVHSWSQMLCCRTRHNHAEGLKLHRYEKALRMLHVVSIRVCTLGTCDHLTRQAWADDRICSCYNVRPRPECGISQNVTSFSSEEVWAFSLSWRVLLNELDGDSVILRNDEHKFAQRLIVANRTLQVVHER